MAWRADPKLVLRALRERLPDESLVYLGDTARVPYGTKSAAVVTNLQGVSPWREIFLKCGDAEYQATQILSVWVSAE